MTDIPVKTLSQSEVLKLRDQHWSKEHGPLPVLSPKDMVSNSWTKEQQDYHDRILGEYIKNLHKIQDPNL
jgi:hypothetical protein